MKLKDLAEVLDQDTYVSVYIANNIPVGTGRIGTLYDSIQVYEDYKVVHMCINKSNNCLMVAIWG